MAMRGRVILIVLVALGLAACAPIPDSGATVTLEPMTQQARAAREAALVGQGGAARTRLEPVAANANANASAPAAGAPATAAEGAPLTEVDGMMAVARPGTAPVDTVAPRATPARPADSGPGVVAFAVQTTHAPGTPLYDRSAPSPDRAARACSRYRSPDIAQAAFLNAGGPASDPQGLDPDGDGFVCGWNPEPFRRAIR